MREVAIDCRDDPEMASCDSPTVFAAAKKMSRLSIIDPELLRATSPSVALRFCGRALQKRFRGDLFKSSFPTKRIQCFWSHSWHAKSWQKILLLMVIYNGRAALVAGTLAAVLAQTLFYFGLLPGYEQILFEGLTYEKAQWGIMVGCVTWFFFLGDFLFWALLKGVLGFMLKFF